METIKTIGIYIAAWGIAMGFGVGVALTGAAIGQKYQESQPPDRTEQMQSCAHEEASDNLSVCR